MPYKAKLVTRSTDTSTVTEDTLNKGSALTHGELDSDLINLRDQSIGIASDDSTVIDVQMGNTLKIAGAGSITTSVSGQTVTITGSASAQGITFVGDDSTGTQISDGETVKIAGASGITTAMSGDTLTITGPSLASFITATSTDTLTNKTLTSPVIAQIVSVSNGDIEIAPDGTGDVNLTADTVRLGDSNANATITTNGTGDLILNTNAGTSSGSITIEDAANGEIFVTPNGEGYVNLGYGDLKANLRSNNTLVPNNAMVDHGANRVWSQTTDQSAVSANTQRIYANNDLLSVQLTGTTGTNNNNRFRQISITEVDLNGIAFGYDHTGYKEPISGRKGLASINNSSASAATVTQAQGANGTCEIGSTNATAMAGDITITDAIGMSGAVDVIAGTGRTATITNAYGQYAYLNTSGNGTKSITNWYALYAATTSATATNKYGVYVADPTFNNYIGGLNFSNGAISTADSTAIQIDEGVNISGTLNAKIIVANEISSEDSTAIQLNDAVNVSGALTTHGSTTFNSFYRDKINALTSSTTITVDANLAPTHKVTLTGNTAFVITNLPTGGNLTLIIVQDATGSRTAAFGTDGSTAVKFAGGTSTLSTAASSIDIVNIYNDGTNYYGSLAKAFA